MDVVYQPSQADLEKLVGALVILGETFLAGGTLEVYASTRNYQSYQRRTAIYTSASEMEQLREIIIHDADILL